MEHPSTTHFDLEDVNRPLSERGHLRTGPTHPVAPPVDRTRAIGKRRKAAVVAAAAVAALAVGFGVKALVSSRRRRRGILRFW